jgi:hypothetical protein
MHVQVAERFSPPHPLPLPFAFVSAPPDHSLRSRVRHLFVCLFVCASAVAGSPMEHRFLPSLLRALPLKCEFAKVDPHSVPMVRRTRLHVVPDLALPRRTLLVTWLGLSSGIAPLARPVVGLGWIGLD